MTLTPAVARAAALALNAQADQADKDGQATFEFDFIVALQLAANKEADGLQTAIDQAKTQV